ncbi:MAG: hypothetical protein SCALA702_36560 [Melioribacteraceae bacterium]|nr:MAG: hypothetical protein SCALA702_36560 [Melioribacteraceae bacterium]
MLLVNIKNISLKRNEKSSIILSNVNFITNRGERLVILGRNGSGKTTLLKAVADLLDDSFIIDGVVSLDGTEYLNLKQQERVNFRREKIGVIFQDPFSSLDPLKKLGYYMKFVPDQEIFNLYLEKLGFEHSKKTENLLPYELSTGMAQKFQIALNFAMDKEIYLLDEPTSALDSISINKLNELLVEVENSEKIIITVTQDKGFAHKFSANFLTISLC